MKKTFIGILPIFFPLAILSCSSTQIEYISSVHDGDTFTDSSGTIYRLFGVDTAEVSDQYKEFRPTTGIEGEFGQEATLFARDLILHKEAKISIKSTDRYGRTVASISYQGRDLATELIKKGLARVAYMSLNKKNMYYTTEVGYYKQLLKEQQKAFRNHVGVWAKINLLDKIFPKAKT